MRKMLPWTTFSSVLFLACIASRAPKGGMQTDWVLVGAEQDRLSCPEEASTPLAAHWEGSEELIHMDPWEINLSSSGISQK